MFWYPGMAAPPVVDLIDPEDENPSHVRLLIGPCFCKTCGACGSERTCWVCGGETVRSKNRQMPGAQLLWRPDYKPDHPLGVDEGDHDRSWTEFIEDVRRSAEMCETPTIGTSRSETH